LLQVIVNSLQRAAMLSAVAYLGVWNGARV